MKNLNIDGVNISFSDTGGDGKAIVFLHYWGGSSRTWKYVIELLAPDYRCIAIDLKGWGESDKGGDDFSLQTQAAIVEGFIAASDLADYALVGHSMGGKIAQIVASHRPSGLKQLALVAPAPPTPMKVPAEQRAMMLASYQSREGVDGAIVILAERPLTSDLREQVIEDTLKGAPVAKAYWTDSGMIEDISGLIGRIDLPSLVIVGDADRVESEVTLRKGLGPILTDCAFRVLPGVGHLSPLEAPNAVAGAIREFVSLW